jgi:hypothetical protein
MKTIFFIGLVWLVGCAASPGGVDAGLELIAEPPADAGQPLTLEAYETQLTSGFCAKIFGCCAAAEIQTNFGNVADEPSCRAMWLSRFEQRRAQFELSIDAGRMAFVTEQASQCLVDLTALACPDFNRWFGPQSCAATYAGRVPDGQTCVLTEDCSSVKGSCLETSPGEHRCVAATALGQPCGEDSGQCVPGTWCVGNSTTGRPVCVQELPLGSPCVVGSQCASQTCGDHDTCEPTPKYCGG